MDAYTIGHYHLLRLYGQCGDDLDDFQNTHTKGGKCRWRVIFNIDEPYPRERAKKEAEPKPKREKSQSIIRQNPKIYRRSLKTDFSVVELDDFIKKSLVDCKNFLNINGLFRGFHQPFFFPLEHCTTWLKICRFVGGWLEVGGKICDSHQVWKMNWWMGPVGLIKSSWPPPKQRPRHISISTLINLFE